MRSRFRPSHGTVVAYLALFATLGGTTYAATGGKFILGKSNTASSKSTLSAPIADKALTVTNNSTRRARRRSASTSPAGTRRSGSTHRPRSPT